MGGFGHGTLFLGGIIMFGLLLCLETVNATPTPIFWRRSSTPPHPHPGTTIVGRPHHHYPTQHGLGLRPGLPQAVAQQPAQHHIWQRPHIHGGGTNTGHLHVPSRPRPPLVGAHHGTIRHTRTHHTTHVHQILG